MSFRWTTSKILPTLAYLTSLDKYQMICILYLVICCVWHSSFAVMNFDIHIKELINRIGLCFFAFVFLTIQIMFIFGLIIGWRKIKELRSKEKIFLDDMKKMGLDEFSDDEDN